MLSSLVTAGLQAVDGLAFVTLPECPQCSGQVSGYDYKERKFATLIEEETTRSVHVSVKRYSCASCNRISYAQAPFYPDTNFGAPVVDLCVTLSESMPYNRTAKVLASMGILVDRGTVRNYARRDAGEISTTQIFGFRLPLSILTLSTIAITSREGPIVRAGEVTGQLPPADRTPSNLALFSEQGDKRDEEHDEKKWHSDEK